jgi:hypothetical protein
VNPLKALPKRWRWAVGLAVASAIGITYAAQVATAGPGQVEGGAPRFSAVELTDAILYQQGPAAKYLSELERPELKWDDELKRSREVINEAIARDQDWGQSYAARMQSGEPLEIASALDDLASFSRVAMNGWLGQENVDRAIDAAGEGQLGQFLICYTWVYIYKYIFFLRYIVIAWASEIKDIRSNGRLPDELTVRAIAVNLRAG